jgi:hypothetical protein
MVRADLSPTEKHMIEFEIELECREERQHQADCIHNPCVILWRFIHQSTQKGREIGAVLL